MRYYRVFVIVALVSLCAGCEISDADRCGEGYVYKDNKCFPEGSGDAGLGDTCTSDGDCGKDDTDYCAKDLGAEEGICTIRDCIPEPDDCPADYKCCDFSDQINMIVPDMCLPEEEWETQAALCSGQ